MLLTARQTHLPEQSRHQTQASVHDQFNVLKDTRVILQETLDNHIETEGVAVVPVCFPKARVLQGWSSKCNIEVVGPLRAGA